MKTEKVPAGVRYVGIDVAELDNQYINNSHEDDMYFVCSILCIKELHNIQIPMNAPSHVCTSLNETLEDTYKN
jgi:hypothetical protein